MRQWRGFVLEEQRSIGFLRELAEEFPGLDLLQVCRELSAWLDAPRSRGQSGSHLLLRRFCKAALKYREQGQGARVEGQGSSVGAEPMLGPQSSDPASHAGHSGASRGWPPTEKVTATEGCATKETPEQIEQRDAEVREQWRSRLRERAAALPAGCDFTLPDDLESMRGRQLSEVDMALKLAELAVSGELPPPGSIGEALLRGKVQGLKVEGKGSSPGDTG